MKRLAPFIMAALSLSCIQTWAAEDPFGCGTLDIAPVQYTCGSVYYDSTGATTGNIYFAGPLSLTAIQNTQCSSNGGPGPSGYSWGTGSPGVWRCTGSCAAPPGTFVPANQFGVIDVLIRVPYLKAGSVPTFTLEPELGKIASVTTLIDTTTSSASYNIIDFQIQYFDRDWKLVQTMNEYLQDPTRYPRPYFWMGKLTGGKFKLTPAIRDNNCTGCEYLEAPGMMVLGLKWRPQNFECPNRGCPIFAVSPTEITGAPSGRPAPCKYGCPQVTP